ncbi:Na+/H+ antiporter subunit A [Nocardioides sp. cx-173]|uniref:Na+/H+ antiporter subunit A n=1 Tax=Nocardioides sp. cx-173 TaxID=2898796 RepID=UPI001E308548|nr:Na+/H+ antiporter subunit A [Nocardioides sp. cx-173]MCD4524796.1 Na+/H+ antiporter subunit A [Nocardioides sp. cx-173]UGB43303.1 Na+/H+ antiporter subunit A [Nocardioides sp. cx-173]
MLVLIAAVFTAAALSPWLVLRAGPRGFLLIALVPLAGAAWVAAQGPSIVDGVALMEAHPWVGSIGIDLALTLGPLQWVMALIVLGIGALVLGYCAWYFGDSDPGVPRFAGVLVAFVGAMLGLVLADDLLLLYVFWELTTVFSFLLIGHDPGRRSSRRAAIQALMVTTLGGLVLLVGALIVGGQAGTFRISEILADPPTGTAVTVGVHLMLVGAISKSALLPFHFWLPSAMAAPTPVSAYLHAASMVKAGVYLVALLAPAFAGVPGWRAVLLVLGVATMLLGGVRALRQHDLKLLLAYGTVSQLGLLVLVLGVGTRSTMLAGLALLVAHALFKATLFLTVGVIDHSTGTRDLRRLTGLGRRLPVLAVAATAAAASMAGLPPLLGYVAKESVLTALLDVAHDGDGSGLSHLSGWLLVSAVVLGSALTAAYSARFVWGAFARREVEAAPTARAVPAVAPGFVAAPVVLAALSLVLGLLGGPLTAVLDGQADLLPPGAHEPKLTLWHGVGLPLLLTAASLTLGALLFVLREPVSRLQARLAHDWSLERSYRAGMRLLDRSAVEITGVLQRGSAAAYLAVILLVVVVLPGSTLLDGLGDLRVRAWDTPVQAVVGVVIVAAAVMTTRSRRRLRAVLLVSVTGYGTALLFVLHGAPDLALTQVLVETLTVVVFVLALRRLPEYFTDRPLSRQRYFRAALGLAVGVVTAGFLLMAGAARTADPVSAALPQEALDYGGGSNIVNVILVDTRAWDTLGEIAVLVAAATGVASLVFVNARGADIRRVQDIAYPAGVQKIATGPGRRAWLPGSRTLAPEKRSIIFEVIVRLIFHTLVVISIYLLLAGHNAPGGGFAAGMTTGLALVVRYLAGGRYELDEAAPVDAGRLIGSGLAIAALAALLPLAVGGEVLQSAVVDVPLLFLGELHLVTSVLFDVGVYLVVVGLVLDLLRALGSHIDRDIRRARRQQKAQAAA